MTQPEKHAQSNSEEHRQPFISQEDRPEMEFSPDKPLSELRVRDLTTILGEMKMGGGIAKAGMSMAEALTKTSLSKAEAFNMKEVKYEKWEFYEPVRIIPIDVPWPPPLDPRIDQLIQTVAGLARQVIQLGNQLEALQKRLPD